MLFSQKIKKAKNVLKRKNMQKYCVQFSGRVSVKNIFPNILKSIEIESIFLYSQNFFFLENYPFQAFLVSKTCIFKHVKKKLYKIAMPSKSQGGGSEPQWTCQLRIQVFFDVLSKANSKVGKILFFFISYSYFLYIGRMKP